jgi:hypothetical protein
MSIIVGVLCLVVAVLIILVGLALVAAEIISGKHRPSGASHARGYAGFDWNGIAAVLNGLAAIFKALKDWPLPALLVLLGFVPGGVGIWVLASRVLG